MTRRRAKAERPCTLSNLAIHDANRAWQRATTPPNLAARGRNDTLDIMLPLDDPKWESLRGGYKTPYDPSGALRRLYAGKEQDSAWAELWEELHHQGDVGEASYAAVPHLVEILRNRDDVDWNAYSLIATIEIERHRPSNPTIPAWLLPSYESAWNDLIVVGLRDYAKANDALTVRAILGVLALGKGLKEIGTLVSSFDESEIKEVIDEYLGRA